MKRIGVCALAFVVAPAVYAAAGNIPGHGEGGPGDQETEQLGGLRFYAGATYDWVQLHITNSPLDHYNLQFADMRVGYRLFKSLGLEFHAGAPTQSTNGIAGRARLNHDFGFFIVPSTVVFDTLELSFPIGYNIFGATAVNPGPTTAKGDVDSFSFGANVEFPIRVIDGGLPDVRLVAGGMMLSTHASQQIYGFRAGLRYDFSFGNAPPPASTPAGENESSGDSSSGGGTPPAEGAAPAPAAGSSSGSAAPASGSSAGAAAPASGSSSGAAAPASGSSAGSSAPASGSSSGSGAPASGSSAGSAAPAAGGSSGSSAPASGSSGSGSPPASGSSTAPASSSSTGAAKPAP